MRTIKMRTTAAGPAGAFGAGQTVTVSDELAEAFLAGGYAESIEGAIELEADGTFTPAAEAQEPSGAEPEANDAGAAPEAATAEPPENAAQPAPRKRRATRKRG